MDNIVIVILLFIIALFNAGLFFVVLLNGKVSYSRLFSLFALAVSLWSLSVAACFWPILPLSDTRLVQFVNALATPIPWFFLLFSRQFTTKKERRFGIVGWILTIVTIVIFLLNFWPDVFTETAVISPEAIRITFGKWILLYATYYFGYFFAAFYLLYRGLSSAKAHYRSQLTYIIVGSLCSVVIGLISNIITPISGNSNLVWIGPLGTSLLIASIGYAIIAHRLFDIRIIIRRTVVFTTLFILIVIAYSALALLLRGILLSEPISDTRTNAVNLVTICIIGFAIEPLRKWLTVRTDQFLFKREYNLQKVLTDLTTRLNTVVNLDEALETFLQTLVKLLHLRHAVLYVFQPGEGDEFVIKRIRQSGYRRPDSLALESGHPLIRHFLAQRDLVLTRDLETVLLNEESAVRSPERIAGLPSTFHREHEAKKAVHEKLVQLKAAVAIPLFLQKQPLGLILLSEKGSGDPYNEDDLALLEAVGSQAVSAIQKAKLYEDDQAKSEFVSIASHELLTPITAVQGYLSMVLEEDAKKIDPTLRSYTEKAFNSTRRLATLVKDLLSVSRIEAGRMQLDLQRVEIDHQIEQALDQLHFLAEEKKLALSFEKPAEPLPAVLADKDRVIEILINLIGNAIKYTPQGSVTVRALPDLRGKLIKVEISDTGLGMSKDAQAHLFAKFYRVSTPETTGIMGTGLGLYITKSIVEKMGGTIEVESAPGKGSTFSFTLPVFQVQTTAAGKPVKP